MSARGNLGIREEGNRDDPPLKPYSTAEPKGPKAQNGTGCSIPLLNIFGVPPWSAEVLLPEAHNFVPCIVSR